MKFINRYGMLRAMVDTYCQMSCASDQIELLGFEPDGDGLIGYGMQSLYNAILKVYAEKMNAEDANDLDEDWLNEMLTDILCEEITPDMKAKAIWHGWSVADIYFECESCGYDCAIDSQKRKCNRDND